VIGYDTVYALQDREDDALVGVKSSALALGSHARTGVAVCYAVALALWASALWRVRPDGLALVALLPMAGHLGWQVARLDAGDGGDALAKFRSNRMAGFILFLACLVVGTS
jgi:4-hydroxybenzoate polyprenyltransferase